MLSGMEITGASAIVTGGASGIGAAAARQLAAKGAKVVVADLNAEKGEAWLRRSAARSLPSTSLTPTRSKRPSPRPSELGPLRALVNSAGIGWAQRTVGKDGEFESAADLDAFKKVIAINLIGTFDCIRLAATAISRPSRWSPANAARSSTWLPWLRSTGRSAKRRTPPPRAASSA